MLKDLIQEGKLEQGLDLIAIKEAWTDVMGSGVQSYTDDVIFKDGSLTVKLSSSVLREELSYGKEKIITMLNEKLNKQLIKKLRLL